MARSPSRSMMIHRKGNEHSQGHRDTGTPTQGRHPYRLLPLATTDTGDRLALARSYPYRRIPTQEGHRQEDRNTQGRHPRPCCSPLLALALSRSMMIHHKGNEHSQEDRRTPTGSPLLARSPSRSMMMHRKGNEHSQGHRDTDRLAPLQGLTKKLF